MAIKFETNVTNEVRMRSLTGELVDSQFGGQQYRFITEAGAFYVSETVGQILHDRFAKLSVTAGEPIEITKREVVKNGRRSIQWEVARIGFAVGEQTDGTFVVSTPEPASELERKLADSIAAAQARKQAGRAAVAAAADAPAGMAPWQSHLLAQTNALTDVFAAALAHASEHHGNAIKVDDIRSIMLSAFINLSKGGAQKAA